MRRLACFGLLALLTSCGRTDSSQSGSQPDGKDTEPEGDPAPLSCKAAIAELASFVDEGGNADSLPKRLESLCEEAPKDLLGTYARLSRGERQAEPDEDTKKWVFEACPKFEDVRASRSETAVSERSEAFWTTCDLQRYGVAESVQDIGINGTAVPWAIHAWMLSVGATEANAASVTRGLLVLDRQWSGPFSYSSTAPVPALPVVGEAPPATYDSRELLVVRAGSLDYAATEVAKLEDGLLKPQELQAPRMEGAPWDVMIHRRLLGALAGRCRRGAWVAVDPEVPFVTLAQVVSTADAKCESIELLVETGEPGQWRVGVLEVDLAEIEPKLVTADAGVEAWTTDDGAHVLTVRKDVPAGTALSAVSSWCTSGRCPKVLLSLAAPEDQDAVAGVEDSPPKD